MTFVFFLKSDFASKIVPNLFVYILGFRTLCSFVFRYQCYKSQFLFRLLFHFPIHIKQFCTSIMDTNKNTDTNLILEQLCEVQEEVKFLRAENAHLIKKAGICCFMTTVSQFQSEVLQAMDTSTDVIPNPLTAGSRKSPPFYISGIKATNKLSKMLKSNGINQLDMKGLANGEIKVTFNSSDGIENVVLSF